MLVKLIGSSVIIFSGLGIGRSLSLRLGRHLKELVELKKMFNMLSAEIRYTLTPLPEGFYNVGNRFDTAGLEKRVETFIPVTCMRGLTWCAMAWVEYQEPGRAIRNESTWKKLNAYLDQSFIDMIEKRIEKM